MCMMCNDEASYRAYMAYMDFIEAEEAAGREPDMEKAMAVAVAAMEALDAGRHKSEAAAQESSTSPLSPFYCDPVQK